MYLYDLESYASTVSHLTFIIFYSDFNSPAEQPVQNINNNSAEET